MEPIGKRQGPRRALHGRRRVRQRDAQTRWNDYRSDRRQHWTWNCICSTQPWRACDFRGANQILARKQTLLRALGAELINTPREEGMLGAEKKAEELLKQIPNSISLRQFHNMANPRAHYETTGPEIYDDLDGHVDYVVAGAGSGGTYSGILKALKDRNPKIRGILADPVGSTMGGGEHGDYNIEGIGNDFIADTMDMSLVDSVIKINDDDAFGGSRELAQKEGIFAGSSTGAAFAAAKKLIASGARGNIVFVAPDRGDRYFSKGLYE